MKKLKFLLITLSVVFITIGATSCQKNSQFDFDLKIEAEFYEPATNIAGTANANVYNFVLPERVQAATAEAQQQIPQKTETDMYTWLNNYIEETIISQAPKGTQYYIKVVGTLRERATGISLHVEKEFKKPKG